MKLWHGSTELITVDTVQEGRFHGMFFSAIWNSAVGLGVPKYYYTTEVPDDDIADATHFPFDHEASQLAINRYGEDDAEVMLDLMSSRKCVWWETEVARAANRAIYGLNEVPKNSFDMAELDWDIQRETAILADKLGYKAVAVEDEHGTSYIVLPGAKLKEEA